MKILTDKYQRQIICEEIDNKLVCQTSGIKIEYNYPYPDDERIKETFEKMMTENAIYPSPDVIVE